MNKIFQMGVKVFFPIGKFFWNVSGIKRNEARAIILCEDKLLLVRHLGGKEWAFPGGGIGKNEDPERCVLRELQEELQMNEKETEYKLGTYTAKGEGKRGTIHIFVVRIDLPNLEKNWEIEKARWFALDDLPENCKSGVRRRIEEFNQGKRDLVLTW